MDYDVLILGGGIVGCSAAYELSKYSLNIALIEKDYDIADDVSLINCAVVYDGCESEDTSMSKLQLMGNSIIGEIANKFNVNYRKCGYLIIAEDEKGEEKLESMYNKSLKRGIKEIYLLDEKQVYEVEPSLNLNINIKKALYSKNAGIISPYDLAIAYGEIAFDNGVNFKLQEEVLDIQKISKGFRVVTNKNKFTCNTVLNTTPIGYYSEGSSSKINKKRSNIKYFLFEKEFSGDLKNIISTLNQSDDKIYTIPSVDSGYIIAIKTEENITYEESLKKMKNFIGNIDEEYISDFYESSFYNDNLIIDDSRLIDKGYMKVSGKNYSQVTVTPAIARIVCNTIVSKLNCVLKKDFIDKRRDFYRFRYLSNEERKEIIKLNKKYGKIICACQKVTEGEIVDSIRRPLGARTIEGIKRRTGVTFGSCMGAQCLNKISSILARETNKNMTDIVKDSKNSKIMVSRIKEFNDI